jgi:hypothetical protein
MVERFEGALENLMSISKKTQNEVKDLQKTIVHCVNQSIFTSDKKNNEEEDTAKYDSNVPKRAKKPVNI